MWARRIQNISVAFCRYLQGYFESPQLDICPFNVDLSSLLRKCSARCSPVKKNIRVYINTQMTLGMKIKAWLTVNKFHLHLHGELHGLSSCAQTNSWKKPDQILKPSSLWFHYLCRRQTLTVSSYFSTWS